MHTLLMVAFGAALATEAGSPADELASPVGVDAVAWTRDGIPFLSAKTGNNIAMVSVTAGYAPRMSFPVNAAGKTLYLMISGATFPSQSHIVNLRVTLRYADGTSEKRELVNPFTIGDCWTTWCGRYHDTAANGWPRSRRPRGQWNAPSYAPLLCAEVAAVA